MPRPVCKDLQIGVHRPRWLTANAPDTGDTEPQMTQIYRRSPIMVTQANETTPMERPRTLYRSCRGHIWVGARYASPRL